VGAAEVEEEGEPFEEKMQRWLAQWRAQIEQAQKFDATIAQNLETLGYDLSQQ
jgi:type I restriction enzyme M protein